MNWVATSEPTVTVSSRFGMLSALRHMRVPALRRDGDFETTAVLIVSSRHRLWQRYGDEGVFEIERAVGQLIESMAMRGLSGTLAYVDDGPILSALGVLPAMPGDADDVARVVRSLGDRLALTEENARHILIIGDDGIVPFHRLENPSIDDDENVLSDHPYATSSTEPLHAARAVGRIPDAGLGVLLAGLRGAAAAHRRFAAGRLPRLAPEAFGYSASVWKRAARGAFTAVGTPGALRLSPPLTNAELPHPGPDGPRFRYYNLHGLADAPEWLGQRDPTYPAGYPEFPVALTPEDLAFAPPAASTFGQDPCDQERGPRGDRGLALAATVGCAPIAIVYPDPDVGTMIARSIDRCSQNRSRPVGRTGGGVGQQIVDDLREHLSVDKSRRQPAVDGEPELTVSFAKLWLGPFDASAQDIGDVRDRPRAVGRRSTLFDLKGGTQIREQNIEPAERRIKDGEVVLDIRFREAMCSRSERAERHQTPDRTPERFNKRRDDFARALWDSDDGIDEQ